jgi:hypothetical protein
VVHPDGADSALSSGVVKGILNRGGAVLAISGFQTGTTRPPRDKSRRSFADFNQTDDAHRVQDILTALTYLRSRSGSRQVNLVGLDIAGVWTYFARTMTDDQVNLVADLAQFRADTDSEYLDRFYIPGLRKAGDFRAAAVLNSRGKVLIHNVGPEFPSDWLQKGSAVRRERLSEEEMLAWIAPAAPPSGQARRVR